MSSINTFGTVDSVASEFGCLHCRPRYPNQTNLRARPGKQISIEDQRNERCASRNCTGDTGMCTVHRKIFGNHKLLYVVYSCIGSECLMFAIGRRLGKNIGSETATMVANYNTKLDKLMQDLRDGALLDVQFSMQDVQHSVKDIEHSIQHFGEVSSLDSLACAYRVGLMTEKKCLDGTRTEILNEIVDWINSTNPAAPRIFWLHGQAGKGKSAIAHTVALQAQNLGMLGSCFCFTRVRQHEGLHTKLFPTIARDLADRDLRLRPLLAKVIANNHSLRDTEDIAKQWEKFIIEPLSQLQGSSTGNTVVVIDALDESGAEATRVSVLKAFATWDAKLPANIRILLTSRPLVDIQEALSVSGHVRVGSLDDIDVELTNSDIRLYVTYRLKSHRNIFSDADIQQVSAKSDGVFEWARLACDFISHRIEVIAKRHLDKIMSRAPGDGGGLLDEMYTIFLKAFTQGSSEVLGVFQSVMRQILWSREPLPISALDFMRDRFPRTDDRYPVGGTLRLLASLLSGTSDTSIPVRPLHASFYDYLLDEKRSGEFFIQQVDVHHNLVIASLSMMHTSLRFNICGLETSYLPNAKIADLDKRVKENIPPHVMYACRFWATHLQDAEFDVGLAKLVGQFISGEQVLFWLEALGVSKFIKDGYWALIFTERWFKVSTERWFKVRYFSISKYHHTNHKLTGPNEVQGGHDVHPGCAQVCSQLCWCGWQEHTTFVFVCIGIFTHQVNNGKMSGEKVSRDCTGCCGTT